MVFNFKYSSSFFSPYISFYLLFFFLRCCSLSSISRNIYQYNENYWLWALHFAPEIRIYLHKNYLQVLEECQKAYLLFLTLLSPCYKVLAAFYIFFTYLFVTSLYISQLYPSKHSDLPSAIVITLTWPV